MVYYIGMSKAQKRSTPSNPTIVELCEFIKQPHTFPGGYTLFALTVCDAVICSDCIASNWAELLQDMDETTEWGKTTLRVASIQSMVNIDGTLVCDRCSAEIE